MLFTSPVFSQASGSIAGITYSHNRGGMYTRARVTPTDPSTARQQIMRAAMGTLAPFWGQTLTQVQRDAWDLYASNVPWINPLGQTIFLTGQQHFLRTNTILLQIDEAIQPVAPIIFDLGTFTAPVLGAVLAAGTFSVGFDNTDLWANGTGGFMLAYCGRPQGAGRNFMRGPWRFSDKTIGDASPPTSPTVFTAQHPLGVGQNFWTQIRFIQTDSRISLPIILGPNVVA